MWAWDPPRDGCGRSSLTYALRRCSSEPTAKEDWFLSRRSGAFVVLLSGKLKDEDIEHVVAVDVDFLLIFESCEEESLTMVCPYFCACVGKSEHQGRVEFRGLVSLPEERKDKRKRPKKETARQKEKNRNRREHARNVRMHDMFVKK